MSKNRLIFLRFFLFVFILTNLRPSLAEIPVQAKDQNVSALDWAIRQQDQALAEYEKTIGSAAYKKILKTVQDRMQNSSSGSALLGNPSDSSSGDDTLAKMFYIENGITELPRKKTRIAPPSTEETVLSVQEEDEIYDEIQQTGGAGLVVTLLGRVLLNQLQSMQQARKLQAEENIARGKTSHDKVSAELEERARQTTSDFKLVQQRHQNETRSALGLYKKALSKIQSETEIAAQYLNLRDIMKRLVRAQGELAKIKEASIASLTSASEAARIESQSKIDELNFQLAACYKDLEVVFSKTLPFIPKAYRETYLNYRAQKLMGSASDKLEKRPERHEKGEEFHPSASEIARRVIEENLQPTLTLQDAMRTLTPESRQGGVFFRRSDSAQLVNEAEEVIQSRGILSDAELSQLNTHEANLLGLDQEYVQKETDQRFAQSSLNRDPPKSQLPAIIEYGPNGEIKTHVDVPGTPNLRHANPDAVSLMITRKPGGSYLVTTADGRRVEVPELQISRVTASTGGDRPVESLEEVQKAFEAKRISHEKFEEKIKEHRQQLSLDLLKLHKVEGGDDAVHRFQNKVNEDSKSLARALIALYSQGYHIDDFPEHKNSEDTSNKKELIDTRNKIEQKKKLVSPLEELLAKRKKEVAALSSKWWKLRSSADVAKEKTLKESVSQLTREVEKLNREIVLLTNKEYSLDASLSRDNNEKAFSLLERQYNAYDAFNKFFDVGYDRSQQLAFQKKLKNEIEALQAHKRFLEGASKGYVEESSGSFVDQVEVLSRLASVNDELAKKTASLELSLDLTEARLNETEVERYSLDVKHVMDHVDGSSIWSPKIRAFRAMADADKSVMDKKEKASREIDRLERLKNQHQTEIGQLRDQLAKGSKPRSAGSAVLSFLSGKAKKEKQLNEDIRRAEKTLELAQALYDDANDKTSERSDKIVATRLRALKEAEATLANLKAKRPSDVVSQEQTRNRISFLEKEVRRIETQQTDERNKTATLEAGLATRSESIKKRLSQVDPEPAEVVKSAIVYTENIKDPRGLRKKLAELNTSIAQVDADIREKGKEAPESLMAHRRELASARQVVLTKISDIESKNLDQEASLIDLSHQLEALDDSIKELETAGGPKAKGLVALKKQRQTLVGRIQKASEKYAVVDIQKLALYKAAKDAALGTSIDRLQSQAQADRIQIQEQLRFLSQHQSVLLAAKQKPDKKKYPSTTEGIRRYYSDLQSYNDSQKPIEASRIDLQRATQRYGERLKQLSELQYLYRNQSQVQGVLTGGTLTESGRLAVSDDTNDGAYPLGDNSTLIQTENKEGGLVSSKPLEIDARLRSSGHNSIEANDLFRAPFEEQRIMTEAEMLWLKGQDPQTESIKQKIKEHEVFLREIATAMTEAEKKVWDKKLLTKEKRVISKAELLKEALLNAQDKGVALDTQLKERSEELRATEVAHQSLLSQIEDKLERYKVEPPSLQELSDLSHSSTLLKDLLEQQEILEKEIERLNSGIKEAQADTAKAAKKVSATRSTVLRGENKAPNHVDIKAGESGAQDVTLMTRSPLSLEGLLPNVVPANRATTVQLHLAGPVKASTAEASETVRPELAQSVHAKKLESPPQGKTPLRRKGCRNAMVGIP